MRSAIVAALMLVTGCASIPPLRPADPAQAVAHEPSAATSLVDGVRVVVRPDAWKGYAGDLNEYFTPLEVAITNDSGRPIQVRPASFTLLTPDGFRFEALSSEDLRHALGPWRGTDYGFTYSFYTAYPVHGPYYPWTGPGLGWWGWGYGPHPWWGAVPYYGSGYGIPSNALTKGTLASGGRASILVFFPVAENGLKSLELDASFVDPAGKKVADLRVPFVREGHPVAKPLPATAAPPSTPQQPGASPPTQQGTPPAEPPSWETTPPTKPPSGTPPPPPVDQPVGPPVPPPDASSSPQ